MHTRESVDVDPQEDSNRSTTLPPYLTSARRDFVLGTLEDVALLRDKDDTDLQLLSMMELIEKVASFEHEVAALLANLEPDGSEDFNPEWYVQLFAARVLHAALSKRTFLG